MKNTFESEWTRLHQVEWLFPDNLPPCSATDYLAPFAGRELFAVARNANYYTEEFLKEHKDRIVYSSHVPDPKAPLFMAYTVVQMSRDLHVVADWLWHKEESEFVFLPTVYYKRHLLYREFLWENKSFEFSENKPKNLGF